MPYQWLRSMGGSGSKSKGASSGSGGDSASVGSEQSLARLKGARNATPFVFTRRSSLYYDEDGDLAHEFYEETVVTKNGRKKSKLKRIQKNLIPQGIIKLDHPCIHVDFPIILCEGWTVWKDYGLKRGLMRFYGQLCTETLHHCLHDPSKMIQATLRIVSCSNYINESAFFCPPFILIESCLPCESVCPCLHWSRLIWPNEQYLFLMASLYSSLWNVFTDMRQQKAEKIGLNCFDEVMKTWKGNLSISKSRAVKGQCLQWFWDGIPENIGIS